MSFRVTQSMMNSQLLSNLNTNMNRMSTLQDQLATGKKINKPSDDPIGITFALRYRTEIGSNDQYKKNVDTALSQLEYTDTTLGQATEIMQRFRELVVKGANGTLEDTSMAAIKTEVSQLYNQMVEVANGQFNGKQMFNGEQTGTKPYSSMTLEELADPLADPPQLKAYQNTTDDGKIQYELSPGMTLTTNVTGTEVFGDAVVTEPDTESDNAFQLLRKAHDMLESGDQKGLTNMLGQIDSRMDKMLTKRAEVGAKVNRVEIIQDRLEDVNLNLKSLKSKVEDADMAEVITNITMEENVYQASLSAGARIIQPSLLDFLR